MKTKLTLIVMEVFPYQRGSVPEANVLVDVNGEFPSEFVSKGSKHYIFVA
jgi:hypothetical protein